MIFMMDIDQSQRRDIDNIQNDKISLTIDNYNVIDSPLNKNLYNFMVDGYNWIKNDNRIFKYNLVENDKLVFHIDKIDELFEKIITNIKISFEIENGNNNFIFNGVNLVHDDIIKSKTFNEFMNKREMVFDCGTFNYSDLDFIVNGKEFDIELLFNGNKSNSMFSLKNVYVIFEFVDKLTNESDTVVNRLEPQIDFYRDENGDLILQIGDGASGKGIDREDRNIVNWSDIQNKPSNYPPSIHNHDNRYYTESEIDNALNDKADVNNLSDVATTGDYDDLIDKPIIPSNISDLVNDSDFIEKSNETGLVKNDGTIKQKIGDITIDGAYDNIYPNTFAQDNQGVDRILFVDASDNDNIRACEYLPNYVIKDSNAHSHIGSSANANQSVINSAIDTALGGKSDVSHNHDDRYYTESEVDTALNGKQNTLVSGTNIKTINNTSLLGTGNINIQGGGSVTIDSTWITGSTNPAESQLIQSALDDKTDVGHTHNDTEINSSYTNIEMGTLILATLDDVIEYNEPFTRINRALEHMLDNWEYYD